MRNVLKKDMNWQIVLGSALIALSAVVYLVHYAIFRDSHHIFIYMVGDIAFVFTEVLMVTLIIHKLLNEREKRERLEKLNMVIGAFFSEVGTKLLAYFSDFDPDLDTVRKELIVTEDWSDEDFEQVARNLRKYRYHIEAQGIEMEPLKVFLKEKRGFMLRLLENPTMLEHESFTKLLRAVFHLTEEVVARDNMCDLTQKDCSHVSNDIRRAYILLVYEWLDYMRYLKDNYPYYFSFALRTNPFDQKASVMVQ